jgi:hypothetical protein
MSAAVTPSAKPIPICGVSKNGDRAHNSSSTNVAGKMRRNLWVRCCMSNDTAEIRYRRMGIPMAAETITRPEIQA